MGGCRATARTPSSAASVSAPQASGNTLGAFCRRAATLAANCYAIRIVLGRIEDSGS